VKLFNTLIAFALIVEDGFSGLWNSLIL